MLSISIFGFEALWSPYFLGSITILTVGFFLLTTKYRSIFDGSEPLTIKQGILFLLSMIILYVIKGSPLDIMAHLMFYVHMIQMAALVLFVPPLLIMGVPGWVWRKVISIPVFHSVFSLFTKPLIALLIFNVVFSFYHVPMIFDHVMQNRWLHAGYSILLFVVAVFMWWPLMNELPEHQTLNGLKKVAYIFAGGMLLTPACALIIFSDTPLYATYSDPKVWGKMMSLCVGMQNFNSLHLSGPEVFSSMSVLHDQQLGGVIMKVIQEIVYGIMLGHVFFEWYKNDQAESEREMQQALNPSLIK